MRVSVQGKLFAAFGIVVALLLAVGLIGIARLGSDNRHLSRLASQVVPSTRAVGDVDALMNKYRKDQLHYIVARPQDRPLGVDGSISGDLAGDLAQMKQLLRANRKEAARGGCRRRPSPRGVSGAFHPLRGHHGRVKLLLPRYPTIGLMRSGLNKR